MKTINKIFLGSFIGAFIASLMSSTYLYIFNKKTVRNIKNNLNSWEDMGKF